MLLKCGVGEDSWESLELQGDPSSHLKGDQSWVFIRRTDAEAETPIFWPPDAKSWLIGKDPDAGKDWGQEEKGTTEDEVVGWHHRLNGHGFGWTPGVGDGQGGLVCCGSWGHKKNWTQLSDWTELNWHITYIHTPIHKERVPSTVAQVVKNPSDNAGDLRDAGSILGLRRSPGGGHANPLQYSCLENPMDRGAWLATIHRVTKSQTGLKQLSTQHIVKGPKQGCCWKNWKQFWKFGE